MVTETDLELADGRTLHAYDAGTDAAAGRLAVFWHHGSLDLGAPPEPLFPAAEGLAIRWASYDRPGYGGSSPSPDRGVATAGRAALEKRLAESGVEPDFGPEDEAALAGEWSWFMEVFDAAALAGGTGGFVDDDLAGVGAWGFDPAEVSAPALFVHGGRDRVVPASHGEWLARRVPSAELWLRPDDGHVSILNRGAAALVWLREHAKRG